MMPPEEKITSQAKQGEQSFAGVDEEHIRKMAEYMHHSNGGRLLYAWMRFIMILEGIVWEIMDALRSYRMKIASKINSNYQRFK